MTSRHVDFPPESPAPAWWANRVQDRLGPLTNLRLRQIDATTIEAPAGAGDDAAVLSIEARWRWIEATVQRAHPGGPAGVYLVFAVAAANSIPQPTNDQTPYGFSLRIVPDGQTPDVDEAGVDVVRRVARLDWDGAKITGLRQEVGQVAGPQLSSMLRGPLSERPAADEAGAGARWIDEFSTEWLSDGTSWLLAGGSVPFCRIGTFAQQNLPANTLTDVLWFPEDEDWQDAEVYEDRWAMHAPSSQFIVVPYPGVWRFEANLNLVNTAANQNIAAFLSFLDFQSVRGVGTGDTVSLKLSGERRLVAGAGAGVRVRPGGSAAAIQGMESQSSFVARMVSS